MRLLLKVGGEAGVHVFVPGGGNGHQKYGGVLVGEIGQSYFAATIVSVLPYRLLSLRRDAYHFEPVALESRDSLEKVHHACVLVGWSICG